MRKTTYNLSKNYSLDEIMSYSKTVQKKVVMSLSLNNRLILIDECRNRYHSALNDCVNFSYTRINKYANIYTLLLEYNDAA